LKFYYQFAILVIILSISSNCAQNLSYVQLDTAVLSTEEKIVQPAKKATFTIVDKNVSDTPIKTQVEQHILIDGLITDKTVNDILIKQYESIKNSVGYLYHNSPTHIFIYIYDSTNKAKAGAGLWIGMLSIMPSNDKPTVKIKSDQIKILSLPEEQKYGLSESLRKKIYAESWSVATKATDEAMAKYPNPNDWQKQIKIEEQLQKQYEKNLLIKYKINLSQLKEIELEGLKKQWSH